MKVFLTGATGFIGSAIVRDLLAAGHQVLGLARSEASAAALAAAGAAAHRGSLADLESLRSGAAAADGVIHCAFIHDFSTYAQNGETDRRAVEAIGAELVGSERPLVVTSGTAFVQPGRVATEQDAASPSPRTPSEEVTLALAARGVRASVVRLPPSVHGEGDHGFVPLLIGFTREQGVAAYVGDGRNVWPAVHRLDAARLFRLALEKGAAGARYHGVAEEGVPFGEIMRVIGERVGVPVVAWTPEQAAERFGWMAMFATIDNPTASAWTQERLDWRPQQPGLLADLDRAGYFAG